MHCHEAWQSCWLRQGVLGIECGGRPSQILALQIGSKPFTKKPSNKTYLQRPKM